MVSRMDYRKITADDIELMAIQAHVTVTQMLNASGVSRTAFYRAKRENGKDMKPVTKAKLIAAIEAEKAKQG